MDYEISIRELERNCEIIAAHACHMSFGPGGVPDIVKSLSTEAPYVRRALITMESPADSGPPATDCNNLND